MLPSGAPPLHPVGMDTLDRNADGDPLLLTEFGHAGHSRLLPKVPDRKLLDIPQRLFPVFNQLGPPRDDDIPGSRPGSRDLPSGHAPDCASSGGQPLYS